MDSEYQRFRIDIAYDGRGFDGWQSQPSGNTIQDVILCALQSICDRITAVHGSGRTDSGVCALGQVAHYDVPIDWRMDANAWQKALNAHLPPAIRIVASREMDAEFHARFSAVDKTYRYRIYTCEVLPPLEYGLAWHRRGLDGEAFIAATQVFTGTHYFRAFSANRHDGKDTSRDTQRTIHSISAERVGELLEVDIRGSGFLYKMVRFLMGSADYVASGKLTLPDIEAMLAQQQPKTKAPYCAPADGLTLLRVNYDR